jgi:ribonuclease HII
MGSAIQDDLFGQINSSLVKVGVDEVGRGCIAGPVVACACFAQEGCRLPKVFDSKTLSKDDREIIFTQLSELEHFHFAFGIISSSIIDEVNILQATFKAMKLAINRLPQTFDEILVDGSLTIPGLGFQQTAIIKGDSKEPLISAASILAKVFRDKLMDMYGKIYPEYGFEIHKGYGTGLHLEKVKAFGATPIHRLSFAPFSKKIDQATLFLPLEDFYI